MIIALGSDHAGFALKSFLSAWLLENGHQVHDVGTYSTERVDYPEYGAELGRVVASGDAQIGIGVCGSGQGICMAANKIHGIRGAVLRTVEDAQLSRAHNDANIACLGERATEPAIAQQLIQVFIETSFDGGRHAARVAQLNSLM